MYRSDVLHRTDRALYYFHANDANDQDRPIIELVRYDEVVDGKFFSIASASSLTIFLKNRNRNISNVFMDGASLRMKIW